MAWYSDEAYAMISDSKEKKSVAASAFKQRTHCGRGGSVKFPSDYLSKKELKSMNGECVKYASLKKPMTWEEFKALPDDLKKEYIKSLREKFNVPDKEIGEMLGVHKTTFVNWMKCIGCSKGKNHTQTRTWNRDGWLAWLHGADESAVTPSETPVEVVDEEIDISDDTVDVENTGGSKADEIADKVMKMINTELGELETSKPTMSVEYIRATSAKVRKPVVPEYGSMTFTNQNADRALDVIRSLLGGAIVNLTIDWQVKE